MTSKYIALSFSLLVATSCTPPVEAPAELNDLSLYLFANFDSESGAELVAGSMQLSDYLLTIDRTGNVNDRAVTLDRLLEANLGGLSQPAGIDPILQIPVGLSGQSVHDFNAHLGLVAEPNHICISSDSTAYAMTNYLTDVSCFIDGTCDRVNSVAEVRKETALAKVWYDYYSDYRRFELDDGRQAMIARSWITDQALADNENKSWDQLFTLDAWIEDPNNASETMRFYGIWSSASIGLGDDAWAVVVKNGVDEAFIRTDEFLSGESCSNDRNREYDRPQ